MIALIIAGAIVIALIGSWFAASGAKKNARAGRPAAPVAVAKVTLDDMPVTLTAIGNVTPTDTAIVRSQLSGNLVAIRFHEGQMVTSGQVIAQIDPRPYRLAAGQSAGNLERDEAQLASARIDLTRYRTLVAQDSIARQTADTQAATVHQLEGTVMADRAALGTSRLNVSYASVKAPITGQIGLKQVNIGNYVTPGDTAGIATITRTDPIDVTFALPQSQLSAVRAHAAGGGLPVTVYDSDGTTPLAKGSFTTFDNQIDTATGTIKAKARFANPGSANQVGANQVGAGHQALFPNQFVNVTMLIDTLRHVPVVPVSALRHGAPGDFVFVVQGDQTVKLTVVKPGPSDGSNVAILSGLRAGDTVVAEGADGLDNGSKVRLPGGGGGAGSGGAAANGGHGHYRHHSADQ